MRSYNEAFWTGFINAFRAMGAAVCILLAWVPLRIIGWHRGLEQMAIDAFRDLGSSSVKNE